MKRVPHFVTELPLCTACQEGKQSRLPFPKKAAWRATSKLQLIHSDVGGPLKPESLNGSKYYLLFIHDFSRFCWIFFMKEKSEVATIFWKFKKWVETQSSREILTIRTDNGGEFTSGQFNKILF